jgi:acyl-CoA thioester hydrolase
VGGRRTPLAGDFRFEQPVDVRFVDTDAFGHVNNAVYLSYFEAARAGYYARVMGIPFNSGELASGHAFVIAEARVSYRAPAYFGETLLVGCRFVWTSRSSFGLTYRIRAEASGVAPARLVADGETVQVMYDLSRNRISRVPADLLVRFEEFEGTPIERR